MNTLKQRIIDVGAYANVTPRAAELIQRFFLDLATQEEKDELDAWMNESQANETMFDLMIEANKGGTGPAFISVLMKVVKKAPPKPMSRRKKIILRSLGVALVVLLLDHFMPSHPLSRLVYGPKGPDFVERTVETGAETKTVWLPDSSRVELLPHSKLGYPADFFWSQKRVELTGSAKFDVRASGDAPLRVRSGDVWVEIPFGTLTLLSDSGKLVVQQRTQ
ncbi:FecR domain-containing protein [Flavihumibacter fluvii]|uniref:FecR domain-containing protein n=1 Tax=Flavihumibacter fluvii TaxID=2838157 RepID=UPI001BDE53DF|nr:FecR domain-containing protein [Flavihumibacter fluvii]ULQ51716.1 FecR family protein [Flavihumibacter fluvii]